MVMIAVVLNHNLGVAPTDQRWGPHSEGFNRVTCLTILSPVFGKWIVQLDGECTPQWPEQAFLGLEMIGDDRPRLIFCVWSVSKSDSTHHSHFCPEYCLCQVTFRHPRTVPWNLQQQILQQRPNRSSNPVDLALYVMLKDSMKSSQHLEFGQVLRSLKSWIFISIFPTTPYYDDAPRYGPSNHSHHNLGLPQSAFNSPGSFTQRPFLRDFRGGRRVPKFPLLAAWRPSRWR